MPIDSLGAVRSADAALLPGRLGLEVPAPGPGVCTRCRGPARHGPGECWCCREVTRLLGGAAGTDAPVHVAALCRPGDRLHSVLRRYKDGPVVEARRHHVRVLARMLDRLLIRHLHDRTDAGGGYFWDAIAAVPSSSRAMVAGRLPCPVDAIVDASRVLAGSARVVLDRGATPCRHLHPAHDAFVAPSSVAARRVLVVDDTWVTGARARSAAAALGGAGAIVAGVAVVGRSVDPECSPALSAWWERMGGRPLG